MNNRKKLRGGNKVFLVKQNGNVVQRRKLLVNPRQENSEEVDNKSGNNQGSIKSSLKHMSLPNITVSEILHIL